MKSWKELLVALALLAFAQLSAQKVYTTYLWHMDQPVYWAEKSKDKPDSKQYVEESHRLKMSGSNLYTGSSVAHPTNNLEEIFSKADRVNAYQQSPRDAVNSIRSLIDAGAQLSISAGLMENIQSLGVKNQWGYSPTWMNPYNEAISWKTTDGFPRLDVVSFTWDHALSPLVSARTLKKQILAHQYSSNKFYGHISKGYWPAEAAFSERIIQTLVECGIEWSIVPNSHLARTLSDYQHPYNINGNVEAPNRADQVPAVGTNWFDATIDGRGSRLAVPYSYQAHKAQYVDPTTGSPYRIDVVPMCNYFSYVDGYSGANVGDVEAKIAPYSTTERPTLLLLAHDGDNAWGGGFSYYYEAVSSFTHAASQAGYKPTTIQQFLNDNPVPTDAVVHVEDGAWVNAESDWGHPQFINWLWPLYSKSNYRFDPEGWTEDARNWAVITATENYVTMAEDMEGGNLRIDKIADGGTSATSAEKAWHFYFGGLNSGFMYYGKAEDMEVKPSLTGNIAIGYAQEVINAHPGVDQTAPSVFIPQRFPYNPGGTGFGPLTGYQKVSYDNDFHVWTYAYDVSGLASVKLKYRLDKDGWNPITSIHNDTYAGGDEVEAWISVEMNRQPMKVDPTVDSELNFFIVPQAKADLCYAEITGYKDVLIDYYVEATDAKGNVFNTPIQHVYVAPVEDDPEPPAGGIQVAFKRPADWGDVPVHLWAWNNTGNFFNSWPGILMNDDGNDWFSYNFGDQVATVNVIFSRNGNPQSVDITGVNQSTCYEYDALNGNKFTVKAVECPTTAILPAPANLKARVYPQPAAGYFIVELPNLNMDREYQLSVLDLNGREIRRETISKQSTFFNRANMVAGAYLLRVTDVEGREVVRTRLILN